MTNKKYCQYCKPNPVTLIGSKMMCNGVNIQYGYLNHYQPGCRTVSCAINFCPMCGRPIGDDERNMDNTLNRINDVIGDDE